MGTCSPLARSEQSARGRPSRCRDRWWLVPAGHQQRADLPLHFTPEARVHEGQPPRGAARARAPDELVVPGQDVGSGGAG